MAEAIIRLTNEDCRISCTDTSVFSVLKDQAIFMTGGTGFMGKWIAEMVSYINETENYNIRLYLLGRNIQNFKTEVPHLAKKPFIFLIEQDVRNINDLQSDINYIINAAGSPDNREHVSQPLRTIETFYKGTHAVLNASTRLSGLKKIIHISSHQIYGKNESDSLIREDFTGGLEPNTINNAYAEAKRVSETLCAVFRSTFRLPILTMRPFAFVGPYQDLEKPWAINNFIRDGSLGTAIRIIGNGSTVRSYLYASDMAHWILTSLVKGVAGEVYNLGSNVPISLNELAVKVKTSVNKDIEILVKSSKESYNSISKLVPDNTKIVEAFNVTENFTIEESINKTIVWNQLTKKT